MGSFPVSIILSRAVITRRLVASNHVRFQYYYYYYYFTLGIKDPEGFGKNGRKCVGVTITPGSPQTQRNHVAARR